MVEYSNILVICKEEGEWMAVFFEVQYTVIELFWINTGYP